MNHTIQLEKNDLKKIKAVSLFAAKNDIRYYINGLLFENENEKLRIVATNGHSMACALLQSETSLPNFSMVMPAEGVKRLLASGDWPKLSFRKEEPKPKEEQKPGFFDITTPDGQTSLSAIDGRFPDWRRVLQFNPAEPAIGQYDPALLGICAAASKVMGNKTGYFAMTQHGTSGALFSIANDIVGVVMPYSGDSVAEATFEAIL